MAVINKEEFEQNLLLTQVYCEMQLRNNETSPAEILRSINPKYVGKPLYSFLQGQYSPPFYQSAQCSIYPFGSGNEYFYTDLFKRQLLYKRKIVKILDLTENHFGQILIADIDYSIPDGVSEAESRGFIDENDCPPIDTWFYMEQNDSTRKLYAWIPEQFVELVNGAVDVNALDIFNWESKPRYRNFV